MNVNSINSYLERSISQVKLHPFIYKSKINALTEKQIKTWIMCAGRESRSFPEIIKNMMSWISNENIESILASNLDDEYGNGNQDQAHFMHYLQLLRKINVSESEFINYEERAGIKLAVSLAYNISMSKNIGMTLGYMLINEALTPLIYEAVKMSIQRFYPNLNTSFFDVHIEVDEHHIEQLYIAIEELSEDDLDSIYYGISMGERGMTILLDESIGIFDLMNEIPPFTLKTNTGVYA